MGGRKVPPITNQPWHTTLSPCLWHGTQLLLNILHMALLNPLQTDIIPDIHIVCFLSTLSTDINSMAVFAESLGIRFHFLWCGARKLMKDMSRNLGCKRTEIGISYYFFSPPPPPRAANEQSGMNGFQLLYAGDWVMVVILNGPLRPRCVCSSVKPWLGSWLGSVWLKSNSCKVIL